MWKICKERKEMKTGKPKLAPKVPIPSKKKPNAFFREKLPVSKGKSAMSPLSGKKLSK
jgi:hypothetical protein